MATKKYKYEVTLVDGTTKLLLDNVMSIEAGAIFTTFVDHDNGATLVRTDHILVMAPKK